MIGRLNHVAIAVRDIAKASEVYQSSENGSKFLNQRTVFPLQHHEFGQRNVDHVCQLNQRKPPARLKELAARHVVRVARFRALERSLLAFVSCAANGE